MVQGKMPTILLVETDASLRRLMTIGLQQHGMRVIEVSSSDTMSALDVQQLDLLVLDIDNDVHSNWQLLETAQSHPYLSALPIVALAWEYPVGNGAVVAATQCQVTYLTKPFDARILYATIEQFVNARAAYQAASEARAEEILLSAYAAHAAPSIWPVITAAGLLLVVIGMLLSLAVTAVGILVVIVALLCWTLDVKPRPSSVAAS